MSYNTHLKQLPILGVNLRKYFSTLITIIAGLLLSFLLFAGFIQKAHAAGPVIVDDSEAAFAWEDIYDGGQPPWRGTSDEGYKGNSTYTGNSRNSSPQNIGIWTANVTGTMEVFASIPSGPFIYTGAGFGNGRVLPLTQKATYKITHAGGETTKEINQRANEGKSVSLGTYTFDGTAKVYLNDVVVETGGDLLSAIVFDSISFGGEIDMTPPLIEDVKPITYGTDFYIQAKITDPESGISSAQVFFNGQFYTMKKKGDIYSAKVSFNPNTNLNYYIIAKNGSGISAIWNPTKGYVSRGAFYKLLGQYKGAFYPWNALYRNQEWKNCDCINADSQNPNPSTPDPVNTFNGNLIEKTKLVILPGRPEIDLHMTYNSLGGRMSIFGENRTHSYNYHLLDMDNEDFVGAFVQYPDGKVLQFNGSSYTPEAGYYEKLTKTGDGFELLFKDLSKVIFDAEGDIKRWEDANGNGINFTYESKEKYTLLSKIKSIKADGGRELTLNYNDKGFVKEVVAPEGKTIKLEYSDKDDLNKLIDGNGWETKFEYKDDTHLLLKKISPKGHTAVENEYDSEKRVTLQKAGIGFVNDFEYQSNQTEVADAYGKKTIYKYENELLKEVVDANSKSQKYEYNGNKEVKKYTDKDNNVYEYDYDSKGNKKYEKDPLGKEIFTDFDTNFNKPTKEVYKKPDHITRWEYDTKGNLKKIFNAKDDSRSFDHNEFGQIKKSTDFRDNPTNFTYNPSGDLETVTDAKGKTLRYEYDGLGRMKKLINKRSFSYSYNYDKNDNLLSVDGPLGYHLGYEYDKNNHIIKAIDANNGETKFTYDNSENLVKVLNQLDFKTEYKYGLMNEPLEQMDPEDRVTKFKNDDIFNITEIRNAVGTPEEILTKVSYNNVRSEREIIDPENRITKLEVDPLQRLTKQILNSTGNDRDSENNVTTSYEYSATGVLEKVIDANDNPTTYELDVLDRVIKKTDAESQITKYEYDDEGNVSKTTNPRDFSTNYEYDELNRLKKVIDAKNGVTEYEYDENSNLIQIKDANGVKTKFVYNELDRLSEKIENFVDGGDVDAYTNVKTKYGYDNHGNLTSVVNPRGFTTKFVYDAAFRNTQVIDAVTKVTYFEYDKVNNLKKVIDRNNNSKSYDYDALNRVVKFTNAEGHTETYGYDKVGNQIKFVNARTKEFTKQYDPLNRVKVATDVYGKTQLSKYDSIGNLVLFTDENGHTDKFEYDKVYRLRKTLDGEDIPTEYEYDKNGNLVKTIDGETNPTSMEYDELDRLVAKTNAENETEKYAYDALRNVVLYTEADNTAHKYNYDSLYRLLSVIDNSQDWQTSTNDRNVKTSYEYDANGNLLTQFNALNHPTRFEYNELDRLIKETNPLLKNWQYSYDFVGNLTKRTDANGIVTNYSYFPDDKLQKINYPTYNVDYTYSETNYPTQMKDNLGVTVWNYDDLDRIIDQKDPLNRTVAYKYDFVGNVTNLKYPDGRNVTNEYLRNDWLKRAASSDNDEVKYTRNRVGRTTKIDRTNSSYSDVVYDKVYRTLSVHDQQIGSGDHLISDFKYTYNDVGHITNKVSQYGWRQPSKVTADYKYDGLHRLIESKDDNDNWTKYTYDAAGNRELMEEYIPKKKEFEKRDYFINPANQITKIEIDSPMNNSNLTREYKYDANGNRIDLLIKDETGIDRGVAYSYDFENRLTRAQDYQGNIVRKNQQDPGIYTVNNKARTDLEYDGNGRRLVKTYHPGGSEVGKRTEYAFDQLDPIAEFDMWNGQYENMYRDANQDLMFYQEFKSQQAPNGTLYWYHYDGEGNIAATTKHQAQSDHTYRYDEYGSIFPENGNPASNRQEGPAAGWTSPHNEYTLTQKEYDSHMNLYYFGARHYDAYTGSWTTQDTYRGNIRDPQSLNRYMYNNSSPMNYVDKYGYYSQLSSSYTVYSSSYVGDKSTQVYRVDGAGTEPAGYTGEPVLFVNGIQTDKEDAVKAAEDLSKSLNAPVYLVHNPTEGKNEIGMALDLREAWEQKMKGNLSNSTDIAIRETLEDHPEIHVAMAHSQGALYLAGYTANNAGRLDLAVTFGGAATEIKNVDKVVNYKAGIDVVGHGVGAKDFNWILPSVDSPLSMFTKEGLISNHNFSNYSSKYSVDYNNYIRNKSIISLPTCSLNWSSMSSPANGLFMASDFVRIPNIGLDKAKVADSSYGPSNLFKSPVAPTKGTLSGPLQMPTLQNSNLNSQLGLTIDSSGNVQLRK